jgi:hypothetical protein
LSFTILSGSFITDIVIEKSVRHVRFQSATSMSIVCPKCGSLETHRTRRSLWMRLFRNSICICCYRCGSRSMVTVTKVATSQGGKKS